MRLCTMLVIACVCGSCESSAGPPARVRKLLGDHAVAILSQPQRVEVYRVSSQRSALVAAIRSGTRPTTTTAAKIGDYLVISHDPDQDAAFGRELAALFFAPQAYDFNSAKACIFEPDTLFRVHGAAGYADLVLCFHCQEFQIASYDTSGARLHSAHEDFDGIRDKLAALVKRATGVEPYHD